MRKHGGRGRLARRWICGLVPIRFRAASERRILMAARALGLLAVAGVRRVACRRGCAASFRVRPRGAAAPGPGIAQAPRKGAFRLKGS
jgi:hypothetical protein